MRFLVYAAAATHAAQDAAWRGAALALCPAIHTRLSPSTRRRSNMSLCGADFLRPFCTNAFTCLPLGAPLFLPSCTYTLAPFITLVTGVPLAWAGIYSIYPIDTIRSLLMANTTPAAYRRTTCYLHCALRRSGAAAGAARRPLPLLDTCQTCS